MLFFYIAFTLDYTESEGRTAWKGLKQQPITGENFRKTCGALQDIGKTNLKLSWEILAKYVPMVKATGNRQWVHGVIRNVYSLSRDTFRNNILSGVTSVPAILF